MLLEKNNTKIILYYKMWLFYNIKIRKKFNVKKKKTKILNFFRISGY